jgi:anti-sigma factor RsiW
VIPPTDPFREWDVAYVLGSLSPDDRKVYERHLEVCQPCEHAVCQLAGMTGLLSRVPKDWALGTVPDVPATLLPRLAQAVRADRRRVLVVTVAAILVAAVVSAALTGAFCWWW